MTELEKKAHEQLIIVIWDGSQEEGLTLADFIGKTFTASIGGDTDVDEPKFTAVGTILGFYVKIQTNKSLIYTTVGLFVHHDGREYLQFEGVAPDMTFFVPQRAWFEWPNWKSKN